MRIDLALSLASSMTKMQECFGLLVKYMPAISLQYNGVVMASENYFT
jgi:hypothetical protein